MSIQLELIPHQTLEGLPYQHLKIILTSPDGIIQPEDLKSLMIPESLNPTQGVILEGKASIWLYGCLVHLCHATAWVGCYDPRLGGAVVVESHQKGVGLGDVLKINLP
jgi:CRISPR-associated protein Csx3